MILESSSSDIIQSVQSQTLANQQRVEVISLKNGNAIVLSSNALAYYKSVEAIKDPLGNGLLALAELAPEQQLSTDADQWITEYKSGYVGMIEDKVLLLTPVAIQLFAHKADALRNNNEIARLDLSGLQ